jgi:hypothetical protein
MDEDAGNDAGLLAKPCVERLLSDMDVFLSKEGVEVQECDILVTGFFKDARPLKGTSGWVDWRLNGMLSKCLIEKRVKGDWKETILIPSQGRVTPRMILLIGLGEAKEYSYLRIRDLSPFLLGTLKKLSVSDVCLSLPYEGVTDLDCGKLAEVLIEGMTDCLDLKGHSFDAEWIKNLRIYFAEGKEYFYELLLGVQTAQSILKERMPLRIFTPSEDRADAHSGMKP